MSSGSQEKSNFNDCDFWCETDGENIESGVGTHKTKFVWRVKNYSRRSEEKGEFISSDSFTVISADDVVTKWRLRFYPLGNSSATDGNLSIYLKPDGQETKSRALYEIFIANKYGK